MIEGMSVLFTKIWEEEQVLSKWKESRLTLVHSGGHNSKKGLKNYRSITLVDTIFKGVLWDIEWKTERMV